MKKKVLSVLLASALAVTMLVGCGGGGNDTNNTQPSGGDKPADSQSGDNNGGGDAIDYGSGELKIWAPEAVVETTKALCEQFFAAHPEMPYTVTVEPVGEGDAASSMITDVEAGADLFGFAQDQMTRLVAAGAVTPISGDYASFIASANDEGATKAAMVGDKYYAFPLTSDNGYFLYYDKSVITDVSSIEAILQQCEAAGKSLYFDCSGWYQTAFTFGTGCHIEFTTDDEGNFTAVDTDYASDKGVAALKGYIQMTKSSAYQKGSSVGTATNWAAIVDGTWDSSPAQEVLGENYACAKLPTFTVDGKEYQMSGFGGFKLMGVKPQSDPGRLVVCLELAKYLSDTDAQLTRFNEVGWGPSNKAAQADPAVQADPALAALGQQLVFTIPQGQYPGDYWTEAEAMFDEARESWKDYTDDQLMEELKKFTSKMEAICQ